MCTREDAGCSSYVSLQGYTVVDFLEAIQRKVDEEEKDSTC